MRTVAFCEQDGYARRVLRKHWPDVWLYEDVRTLTAKRLKADGLTPNVVCGGFPCQDISTAGKGAGLDGARSGLWSEMLRIVKEVRPRWVVAENVPALRGRGADRVLADLEGAGYAVRPVVVGAWAVGGNHQRERVWVVGNALGQSAKLVAPNGMAEPSSAPASRALADAEGITGRNKPRNSFDGSARDGRGLAGSRGAALGLGVSGSWQVEPDVGRVADGIPCRVDRLRCLGNAVVPLIPELIGRAIMDIDSAALKAAS
jgi:DNA (cytosine-5)-methyltransferase 1